MSEFSRSVRLFVGTHLTPQARSHALAAFARQDVSRLIQERRASPVYEVSVDGRDGAPLESVAPNGRIVFRFNGIAEAAAHALSYCVARSPVRSGRYRKSWVILVNNTQWLGPLTDIPPGVEVVIVNTQPYHRKIDMGSQGAGALGREVTRFKGSRTRRGVYVSIVEGARQEVLRVYPGVKADRVFIELPNGPSPAPYRMQGGQIRKGRPAAQTRRSSAFRGGRISVGAKFSAMGEAMTYPALVMNWRGA